MNRAIKIEGKPNQRIVVNFDPINVKLIFQGEFKPHNKEWIVFDIYDTKDLNEILDDELNFKTEEVLRIIESLLIILDKKVKLYDALNEGFKPMKQNGIELTEN